VVDSKQDVEKQVLSQTSVLETSVESTKIKKYYYSSWIVGAAMGLVSLLVSQKGSYVSLLWCLKKGVTKGQKWV